MLSFFIFYLQKKCRAPWFVKGSNTYASYSHARFKCTPKMSLILLFKSWILCIYACVMSNELTRQVVMKFLPPQFSWIWYKSLKSNFIHSKIFLSDQIQRAYCKKKLTLDFYTCRNVDSNLILVVAIHLWNLDCIRVWLNWHDKRFKGLKACLWWKVHFAYPASLEAIHSNP